MEVIDQNCINFTLGTVISWKLSCWLSQRSYIISTLFFFPFCFCNMYCFDFCCVYGWDEWFKIVCLIMLEFPPPNKSSTSANASDMARCHRSIYWLFYYCTSAVILNFIIWDVQDLSALTSTLARSQSSPIGFVRKQKQWQIHVSESLDPCGPFSASHILLVHWTRTTVFLLMYLPQS